MIWRAPPEKSFRGQILYIILDLLKNGVLEKVFWRKTTYGLMYSLAVVTTAFWNSFRFRKTTFLSDFDETDFRSFFDFFSFRGGVTSGEDAEDGDEYLSFFTRFSFWTFSTKQPF